MAESMKESQIRYGLEDGYSLTREEVESCFNETKARITEIEEKALARLHSLLAEKLGREPNEAEFAEYRKTLGE